MLRTGSGVAKGGGDVVADVASPQAVEGVLCGALDITFANAGGVLFYVPVEVIDAGA